MQMQSKSAYKHSGLHTERLKPSMHWSKGSRRYVKLTKKRRRETMYKMEGLKDVSKDAIRDEKGKIVSKTSLYTDLTVEIDFGEVSEEVIQGLAANSIWIRAQTLIRKG